MNFRLKAIAVFLLALSAFSLRAQTQYKLSGRIVSDDFSPLSGASIYIARFSSGTFTDSTGQFQINLPAGLNEISFSYIGYTSQKAELNISHDTLIQITLKTNLELNEVTVTDRKQMLNALHDATGVVTLKRENFLSLPAILGEHDPIRAVQMQPGIQSGNEGTRGIFVRGGSPDQNLILLDGTPVYNPSHVYGFTSVFNSDAIDKVDIYKDKYPARYGGRLGSVMDIETNAGNPFKLRGSFTLGLLTSRFHIEGPVGKTKQTTLSLSLRACYAGLYISPISKRQYKTAGYDGKIGYYFADVNFKLAHQFNPRNRIELSFFGNNDFYSFIKNSAAGDSTYSFQSKYVQQVNWANYVTSFAWLCSVNDKWELTNRIAFSDYELTANQTDHYYQPPSSYYGEYKSFYDSKIKSYIRDIGYQGDVKYTPNYLQTFRAGAGIKNLIFETGKGDVHIDNTQTGKTDLTLTGNRISALESYIYVEDEIVPNEHWLINCGFHTRIYHVQQKTFYNFLPRVNLVYSPVKKFSFRVSASGLSQNLHLLATSTSNVLNDYWVPATANARPERGWNFSGGVMQKLPKNFEWSIDGFYRTMSNLIDYKEGANYASFDKTWEEQVATGGKGRAYGAEVYVARSAGRITGSIAYTLAWSNRKYAGLNDGQSFPYKYDRRHNIAVQANFLATEHIELGIAWVYGSGNMFTMPLQSYNSWGGAAYADYLASQGYNKPQTAQEITVYTGKNGYRLPAYHHMDVSFTYKKKVKNLEHVFNFSIYNVYSRQNIFSVYPDYRTDADGVRRQVFKQLSLFPILPSLSYTIKFSA
jgi:outer membrane receptor for ferrienterochelin and colicin